MSAEGLPIGIQFTAPLGQDRLLLELSLEIEQAKAFKQIYH
jgi:Asp-tRNA(Asn)/Glu-tRNA(Gln) amidotransferase A subunit family amidase